MKELIVTIALLIGLSCTASAEVWKWVDENGNVHYGDRPQNASSEGITLARYTPSASASRSSGQSRMNASPDTKASSAGNATESADGKKAREYYCNQASEIYDSYSKAPRLYKTNAEGQREYLSDKEAAALLAETKAKVTEWCT